jgi:hypothetical protein
VKLTDVRGSCQNGSPVVVAVSIAGLIPVRLTSLRFSSQILAAPAETARVDGARDPLHIELDQMVRSNEDRARAGRDARQQLERIISLYDRPALARRVGRDDVVGQPEPDQAVVRLRRHRALDVRRNLTRIDRDVVVRDRAVARIYDGVMAAGSGPGPLLSIDWSEDGRCSKTAFGGSRTVHEPLGFSSFSSE